VPETLGVWGPGLQLRRCLLLAGKRGGRGQLKAVAPGRLLHVADQLTGTKFLVDTGASYSIFPHKSRRLPSRPKLRGLIGQDIACWREKEMAVSFGGEKYTWSFLLAVVQFPIFGVDFLRANSLIVDAAAGHLIHSKSLRQIPAAEGAIGDGGLYAACLRNSSECSTLPAICPLQTTVSCTSWRLQGRPSPPNFGGWMPPNYRRPRRSSFLWRDRGS
jgi:hypothetical protein